MSDRERTPFLEVVAELLRARRIWVGGAVVGLVVGALWGIFGPKRYTAEAVFAPQGRRQNQLATFAQQFGIDLTGFGETESVAFYSKLMGSADFLAAVGAHRYRFAVVRGGADTLEGTLIELYEIRASTPERVRQRLVSRMRRDLFHAVDVRSEAVTIRAAAPWPDLAEGVAQQVLALVNEFNLEKRQSRARAERQFLEHRLATVRAELREAEDALRSFYDRNQRYEQSPELQFEEARMRREVEFQRDVLVSLSRGYEEARVTEVRDTPVITVLQQPGATAKRQAGPARLAMLGFVFGGLLGMSVFLLRRGLRRQRDVHPEAFHEFRMATRETVSAFLPRRLRRGAAVRADGGRS